MKVLGLPDLMQKKLPETVENLSLFIVPRILMEGVGFLRTGSFVLAFKALLIMRCSGIRTDVIFVFLMES